MEVCESDYKKLDDFWFLYHLLSENLSERIGKKIANGTRFHGPSLFDRYMKIFGDSALVQLDKEYRDFLLHLKQLTAQRLTNKKNDKLFFVITRVDDPYVLRVSIRYKNIYGRILFRKKVLNGVHS